MRWQHPRQAGSIPVLGPSRWGCISCVQALALGDPRSTSDLLGHVSKGPTLFLLQLPEWEGSGRSSPAGSFPPSLLSSVTWHGRDLLLGTAAEGDRKEKEKVTDGRGRRVPSALRGSTDASRVAPGFSIPPTPSQSLERLLPAALMV